MIIKSEFKIDLFQLKHSRDPEALLQATKEQYARELGLKLIELMPYKCVSMYEGELPAMSLNRDHEYVDLYRSEFVVLTMDLLDRVLNALKHYTYDMDGDDLDEIVKLLEE